MADVNIRDRTLIVTIKGWHKLWALKSQLQFPLNHVRGAEIDPETARKPVGLRSPGAFVPSFLTAGSYRGREGWDFWDVRHPANAVIIHLNNESYQRLIVEVGNPEETVRLIDQALAEAGSVAGGGS